MTRTSSKEISSLFSLLRFESVTIYQETMELLSRDYNKNVVTPTKRLWNCCQETTTKMIEYLSFLLQCTLLIILGATAYYLYFLLKMAEASINDLLPEVSYNPPESDMKRQKLIECVLTGNSKQYLGKVYTEEQVNKLSAE